MSSQRRMRIVGLVSAPVLLVGGVTVGVAAPAIAHTGDLKVTAVCNTTTGNYDLTANLTTTNVPSNVTGSTMWRVGTTSFQGTPSSAAGMDKGPVSSQGNTTKTLGSWSLPGTTTGFGPWVYAFTNWSNSSKKGSDGRLLTALGGDCKKDEPKVTICHRTASYSNPYVVITVDRSAVDGVAGNSGNQPDHYGEHRGPIFYPSIPQGTEWGDIIPPVAGAHAGYNWTAEGQAVFNNGCVIPDKKVPVPAKPDKNDPCGPNNAAWIVPNDTDSLDWILQSDGRLTVATKTGYKFEDGTTSKDFGKVVDSNEPCKVPVPAKPSYQDPCGPGNASWNVPADTASLDWTLEADGDLVVATKPGFVFDNGSTSKNFGKAPDSGVKCTVPVPPVPSQTDPCGPDNATWNKPADSADYAWALRSDGHLVVTAKGDNTFPDGSTTKDYGLPTDSNEPCKVPVPATPNMTDPCGPNNATWVKPSDTASVAWVLEADGDLVATAKPGFVFENGQSEINFGKAVDSNVPCPDTVVQPPTVPVIDECGPGNAVYGAVPAGPWTSVTNPDGSVTVTANPGNTFPGGSSVTFPVLVDSNVPCPTPPTPTPPPVPPTPTPEPEPKAVKVIVKKADKCETNNSYYVKRVTGAHVTLFGKKVREGTWLDTDRLRIVLKAKADSSEFVLVGPTKIVVKFNNNATCGKKPDRTPPAGG